MDGFVDIDGHEVLTVADMYAADAAAVASGIPGLALMESAGMQCAREIRQRFRRRRRTAILCGPGNNGGDGFVVARYLKKAGWPVRVGLLGDATNLKGDAAANAQRWQQDGGSIHALTSDLVIWADLTVDALFGAGLARPLEGQARAVVRSLLEAGRPCVAVDIPSGVSGDTGAVLGGADGIAPLCDLTVTFFRPKPGHFLRPGRDLCGRLAVVDIGIPEAALNAIMPETAIIEPGLTHFPIPRSDDHKYTRGHVVAFGSEAMSGAIRLGAAAARRVGAGLVTVAAPHAAEGIYREDAPGLMFDALSIDEPAALVLADTRRNAVLIGPGHGVGEGTQNRVLEILNAGRSLVLDADALTSFSDGPAPLFDAIKSSDGQVVMTPHEGEFLRLFGSNPDEDRLSKARAAAAESGATVLLKGSDTVVASPNRLAAILPEAPPWLATAGSGDVLAGIIAGLLAQGSGPWQAACSGAWLHAASARLGGPGLIAEDIVENIPAALR